ncbi:MAG TPA: RsmE family RNA methyltransferase [Flavisolibacter sp.]|jgi:16S rRNA (uracil1498-N3)-methyltransferase|nr:RsmE family RNA methyltransferase [Flavisolibacter sp.]
MALPYFFVPAINTPSIVLDEPTSKHIIQVLRMKSGEELLLTDGKGRKANCTITDDNRKRCVVEVVTIKDEEAASPYISIGISLIKNAARFEWFLEKATEIGVNEIIPLVCDRTEKEKFRSDRLTNILISAMLQSQQCWQPVLKEPVAFDTLVKTERTGNRFIAHCLPEEKNQLAGQGAMVNRSVSSIILIGPEGDFTEREISMATAQGYEPVALGNTRLRTETAGMVAAALLRNT